MAVYLSSIGTVFVGAGNWMTGNWMTRVPTVVRRNYGVGGQLEKANQCLYRDEIQSAFY